MSNAGAEALFKYKKKARYTLLAFTIILLYTVHQPIVASL
ncbi:hypothetical protein PAECIP111893_02681 [Paenibacillus plantiphilus]|uniref:Uncharacterized protein n=1 Tax=Paenibacillus plantiphilus TaxID=2905650 RepID=A0ABN8GKZ2_9BACL|nr:hypothetical protein PAECIP111893_02681 [Paenibacillus plantiphilus]